MRLLAILILFSYFSATGQEVSGVVKNHTQVISFANIHVSGTSNGTISNSKGEFSLIVNNLNDTLVFSCLGFVTKKVIARDIENNGTVNLDHDTHSLAIVTINAKDDKGLRIINNVIKNRLRNDYARTNFITDLYVKSIVEKDRYERVDKESSYYLSFTEKFSKVDHSSSGKWRETTIGVKDLSNKKKSKGIFNNNWGGSIRRKALNSQTKSNLFYANVSDGEFNFYKNVITVPKLAQSPFISPTGKLGPLFYDYSHENIFLEKGKIIHELKVTPKRPEESVFKGTIQIEDSTWAIVGVNLKMNGNRLHRYASFSVYQRYKLLNQKRVLDRQEFFYYYEGLIIAMNHGSVYCKFDNYQFPKEEVEIGNLSRIVLDSAENKPKEFWLNKRSVQLSQQEKNYIAAADSLKKLQNSLRYKEIEDSLKNKFSFLEFIFEGTDHYNTAKGFKWKLDPLIKQARFYGIGGYRHAPGLTTIKEFKNKNELYVRGTANYGFKNHDLLGDGEIKYLYAPKNFAQLRIEGGSKYEMLSYMQNLATLFSRGNFVKNEFLGLGHFFEISNGVFFDVKFRYIKRSSIANLSLSQWSENLFDDDNQPIAFSNYEEFNMKFMLSYTPFQKFAMEQRKKIILGSKWPTFNLGWEQGVPEVFESKINYQKLLLGTEYSFKLGLLGTSKLYSWYSNYIHTNNVEIPNYTFFRGTDKYFFSHPLYSFQLLGNTYTSLKSYLSANYIHHFHGAIIKKVPVLKRTHLETVAGGGALFIDDNNFNHGEIYSGLEIPFRIGETKLKFGTYYTIAYSNYSSISNMIKFGLNVFNPFTNKWAF